ISEASRARGPVRGSAQPTANAMPSSAMGATWRGRMVTPLSLLFVREVLCHGLPYIIAQSVGRAEQASRLLDVVLVDELAVAAIIDGDFRLHVAALGEPKQDRCDDLSRGPVLLELRHAATHHGVDLEDLTELRGRQYRRGTVGQPGLVD